MPRPGTFQFGSEHYLYVGANLLTDDLTGGTGTTANTAGQWPTANEFGNVRDLTVGGGENTVDITTRSEARKGFTVEPIVSQTGQFTFQLRWLPSSAADLSDADLNFVTLLKAWRTQNSVALAELDGPKSQVGAQGLVGNFAISFTWGKPVQGVAVADVTARLVGFPDWVVVQSYLDPDPTFEIIENI